MSQRDSEPSQPDDPAESGAPEPEPAQNAAADVSPDSVISFNRATLRSVDFRKARFDQFSLAGCLFVSCDFRAIRFDRKLQNLFVSTTQNAFRDCRFDGADLRRVKPGQARFERCTFDDAAIDGWRCETAEFVGCRFAGALGTVVFYGKPSGKTPPLLDPPRKRNAFEGNDFRDADLDHVTFTNGVELMTQRLPLAERYVLLDRFPQRLARAQVDVLRWEVQEERVPALAMLRELAMRFKDQREIFASRVSATGPSARVQTRVWTTLERAQ